MSAAGGATLKRATRPWLILALAAVAAFISDYSGPDVGPRLMLLLIAAAIIVVIQNLDTQHTRRHSLSSQQPGASPTDDHCD